jgi:hypothetical protein
MKAHRPATILKLVVSAAGLLLLTPADAAIKKDEGPIPDLRPPRGSIPFQVPERTILQSVVVLAFLALAAGRLLHRRHAAPPPLVIPPIELALRDLDAIPPDAGECNIQQISEIVRRYIREVFLPGTDGATTSEICEAYAAHPQADAESSAALHGFLSGCDLHRFAPRLSAGPDDAAAEARQILALLEDRRRFVNPPPLQVIT